MLFLLGLAHAHPVTFKGGTAVYSIHRPKMTHFQVNYTFHRHAALASSYLRIDLDGTTQDIEAPIAHINTLIKRWNQVGSQANIYGIAGLGYNLNEQADAQLFTYTALQIDYETQRIYTALQGFSLFSNSELPIPYGARYRFGVAPYIAEYDELQIWMVGQLDHMSSMSSQPRFTPIIRLFYRTVLWEMGHDLNGIYWFQMMSHF